ncbi:MAG: DUF4349 domain-containing protein [Halolamina sp.]
MRRELTTVALVGLVLLAGCAGAGSGGAGGEDAGAQQAGLEATGTPAATGGAGGGSEADVERQSGADVSAGGAGAAAANRKRIKTGTVALRVDDFEAAAENVTRLTVAAGGYVQTSSREVRTVDGAEYTVGRLVLRVPKENFSRTFERLQAEGEVQSSSTDSKDVTDRLVDIEARLENLRAERDRLRTLYEEANETEDVLRVERRLSEVQERIERLEARQRTLRNRVAFSTITVRLSEPRPEPEHEPPERWYDTPVVGAFLDSVSGVLVTARALAVATAYVAPYLAVFGLPLAGVAYVVRSGGGVLRSLPTRGDDGRGGGSDDGTDGDDE